MSDIDIKNAIIDGLAKIQDPNSEASVLDAKLVEEVTVKAGEATVVMLFDDAHAKEARWDLEDRICDMIEAIDGVSDVSVSSMTRSGAERKASGHSHDHAHGHDHGHSHSHDHSHGGGGGGGGGAAAAPGLPASKTLAGVGKVIAVASGKGGVGKSTVAVNLALALHKIGHKVGLLDIDVYGPSLPTLLGVKGRPAVKERRIIPLEAEGLRVMSLGFLMDDDTPVIWRGPIVTGIIRQFLQDVDWSGLDYLIIDLPPGTGDAQLSLAQSVPLDGAIVVTTPSDLALIDAARGLQMFKTLKVEVIGIVENMSHYVWPGVGAIKSALETLKQTGGDAGAIAQLEDVLSQHERVYVFGKGGGRKEAKRLGTPFLGEIPLDGKVRKGGDEGKPIVVLEPSSHVTAAFLQLARKLVELHPAASEEEEGKEGKKKKRGLFSFLKG